MKTKDFIKMIQKADPSGEAYIRMPDGTVPIYAEYKEGYYDGPFTYINEEGKYVTSTKGHKVDILTKEPFDYIEELDWNGYDEVEPETLFEEFKDFFIFDSPYTDKEQFFKELKSDLFRSIEEDKHRHDKYLKEIIIKYKNGWKFLQKKDTKLKFYDWDIISPDGKREGANWATSAPIMFSGNFDATDVGEYLEWNLIYDYDGSRILNNIETSNIESAFKRTVKRITTKINRK